jgi:hypothetical protein
VNAHPIRSTPRSFGRSRPATVLIQPKLSSMRLRVVRPSIAEPPFRRERFTAGARARSRRR